MQSMNTTPKKFAPLFPEIIGKWGIATERAEERNGKGSLNERHAKAVRVIKKLRGWRSDSWNLMPVLWLEAKAVELCEKADAERAARAERERQMNEKDNGDKAKQAKVA